MQGQGWDLRFRAVGRKKAPAFPALLTSMDGGNANKIVGAIIAAIHGGRKQGCFIRAYDIHGCINVARGRMPEATRDVFTRP